MEVKYQQICYTLRYIDWGALDHASRAPHAINVRVTTVCVCVCVTSSGTATYPCTDLH